ncbi:MAG: DUF4403 family protein [Granulosicoccus sp.]|nr:DUF4403 family protein [Granulosicoccus sp.]
MHAPVPRGMRTMVPVLLIVLLAVSVDSCKRQSEPSRVSEKPEDLAADTLTKAEPRSSRFGLRARVSYDDIEAMAVELLPDAYPITGTRLVCKRILGMEACGTVQWNLNVLRTAPPVLTGQDQQIMVTAPIRFTGTVGVQGRVAKALGLSAVQVHGAVMADVSMGLTMQDDWCPSPSVEVAYRWIEKPTALWRGRMDFNLESIVNAALDKQLETLEPRLNEAIDCQRFRGQLSSYWRSYTFSLDVPAPAVHGDAQRLHLNIVPTGFAFSGIHTESDKFGVSFVIDGTTVVASTPLQTKALTLPPLRQVDFQSSRTDFDLLLRADYTQLEQAITPLLTNRSFSSSSAAGDVSVQVNSVELSGTTGGVAVALGFTAKLPGSRRDTRGIVYLNANPVVDAEAEQLRLEDIRLSKVLDSTLWNLISTVFEGQIIAAIERGSIFNLSTHARELEQRLQTQLQDPARTGGVTVRAENLTIRLLAIIPEAQALAARAQVSAELDIDIPLTVLKKPLR